VLFDVCLTETWSSFLVYIVILCVRAPPAEPLSILLANNVNNYPKERKKSKKDERLLEWRYWESNPGFESIYDVHNLMSYR
jgi:hypothetical protein